MGEVETGGQQEKLPVKKSPEQENDLSIANIDRFLETANQQIEKNFKDNPEISRQLLDLLEKGIREIKEKVKDLAADKLKALDELAREVRSEMLKFDNKRELQKLSGKEIAGENQTEFQLNYKGKEVHVTTNAFFQFNTFEIDGKKVVLKEPLNPERFGEISQNIIKAFGFLENHYSQLLPASPMVADGTARFGFKDKDTEYMVVISGKTDLEDQLYNVEEKISPDQEKQIPPLKQQIEELKTGIQENLQKEKEAGRPVFKLEDAINTHEDLFPEKFRSDLSQLNSALSKLGELEKKAGTTTLTKWDGDKCLMENSGENSFRIKENLRKSSDPSDVFNGYDSKMEEVFKDGFMTEQRSVSPGDGTMLNQYQKLPNGNVRNFEKFIHLNASKGPREWKAGDIQQMEEKIYDTHNNLISQTTYDDFGKISTVAEYSNDKPGEVIHYRSDSQGPLYKRIKFAKNDPLGELDKYKFFSKDGKEYGDFYQEKQKNPALTPDQYLSELANVFDSPEAWAAFSTRFMKYVYDSPDPDNPLRIGTKEKHGDYWQTPQETVARVNGSGQALGDCDDFAFLAQSILQKQGTRAKVISIEVSSEENGKSESVGHAICVWIKKRPDGKFDAYSICTYGYDKNGNRRDGETTPSGHPQNEAGFNTAEEALNSIFEKYKKTGLGVSKGINYRVKDGKVVELTIPQKGKQEEKMVPINDLIN
jgi:uncharacterized protein YdcH (DUF465 family)